MSYILEFKNNTNLPFLLEFWLEQPLIYPNKKKECFLKDIIIQPSQEIKTSSIKDEWYISSLFLKDDNENNNIWKINGLKNEMISTITSDKKIQTISKNFNVINDQTKLIISRN